MNDYNDINEFIMSCNELIDGKYILADIKIGKILTAISRSDKIYNLLAESLINYDFDKELERIQSMNRREGHSILTLPDDYSIIVPFVFSLLVEIDSKHISFGDFLSDSFPLANSQKEEYEAFARHLIAPFRDAIAHIFTADSPLSRSFAPVEDDEPMDKSEEKMPNNVEPEQELETETHSTTLSYEQNSEDNTLLYDSIARLCGVIREKLPQVKKDLSRSNISLMVDALIEACFLRNFTILVALVMSLQNQYGRERALRDEINEIVNVCYQFYN